MEWREQRWWIRKEEKMEKAKEKREGDRIYVIRGDGMAVGAVSNLD